MADTSRFLFSLRNSMSQFRLSFDDEEGGNIWTQDVDGGEQGEYPWRLFDMPGGMGVIWMYNPPQVFDEEGVVMWEPPVSLPVYDGSDDIWPSRLLADGTGGMYCFYGGRDGAAGLARRVPGTTDSEVLCVDENVVDLLTSRDQGTLAVTAGGTRLVTQLQDDHTVWLVSFAVTPDALVEEWRITLVDDATDIRDFDAWTLTSADGSEVYAVHYYYDRVSGDRPTYYRVAKAVNGVLDWEVSLGIQDYQGPYLMDAKMNSTAVYLSAGGIAVESGPSIRLIALSRENGGVLWQRLADNTPVANRIAVTEDTLAVTYFGGAPT